MMPPVTTKKSAAKPAATKKKAAAARGATKKKPTAARAVTKKAAVEAPAAPTGGGERARPDWPRVTWGDPLLTVLAVFGLLRVAAVIGQQAIVYADSPGYEVFDLSGRSKRPWGVPLLYNLIEDRALRVTAQAVLGVLGWAYLAVQASRLVEHRTTRWVVLCGILALSLTTSVTNWDATLLSESLAISSSALLLGLLIRFWRGPSHALAGLVVVTWLYWIFTRQAHLILAVFTVIVVAGLLGYQLLRTRVLDRPLGVLLAGAVIVTLLGVVYYSRNTVIMHENLAEVIGRRIFTYADDVEWLHDHGMPIPSDAVPGEPREPSQLLEHPDYEHWVNTEGVRTYAWFLLAHPWDTLTRPLESFVTDRPPWLDLERGDNAMLASPDAYGVAREVIPEPVEQLLFDPGHAGTVVFAVFLALTASWYRWRVHGPDRRWLLPLLALLPLTLSLMVVWHTVTVENGRLALPGAVLVRVVLIVQLGLLAEAWLADRRRPADAIP